MHHYRPTEAEIAIIRSRLRYVKTTGKFYWKVAGPSYGGWHYVGDEVTGTYTNGYFRIGVAGRYYRAHHLAWIFVTGAPLPDGLEIHHRDDDWANNRWRNLKAVTRKQHIALGSESASDRNRRLWKDPAYRAARAAAFARPDVQKRRSAAISAGMRKGK